ncbi:MAG: tRNA lysidine(34) synthetase TilS [Solirubrobacterales bacterium]|nr:MAG: tRNA lysidine(34) synthetase TilS [Solirubrobacterales bacterium]
MSALLDPANVRASVAAAGLLSPERPVVVMLSGGRDSVCLLDLAVEIGGRAAVNAVHCNYALREGADEDEALCVALCSALGVALAVTRPRRLSAKDGASSGNLQAWARDVRYSAAFELAAAPGFAGGDQALVATGHTASDQAETILYRLAASPGRRALLGMAARRGSLIRPLLALSREQTAEYCRQRGLSWREDPSNADPTFARARVRHQLLAALRSVHPSAEASIVRTAAELREEAELLDGLVDRELHGEAAIALERLRVLPVALARLVVRRLAEQACGAHAPDAATRLVELRSLGHADGRRAELHLSGGLRAIVESGRLRFEHVGAAEVS